MTRSSKRIQRSQRIWFYVLGALVLGLLILCLVSASEPPKRQDPIPPKVDLPTDTIDPDKVKISELEGENQRLDQKLSFLEEILIESKKKEENTERETVALRKDLIAMREEILDSVLQAQLAVKEAALVPVEPAGLVQPTDLFESVAESEPIAEKPLPILNAPLQEVVMTKPVSTQQNVSSAIPAGTSVKAILVSSLDAPCGVTAPANPRPVKLRIVDDGHLPKDVAVKLRGGIVIASAYGDLSSERVLVRLERLTQINTDGDFVETTVAGYVSGEDGRYGVRGNVVDNSRRMLASATKSGVLAGASQFLQATVNAQGIRNATAGAPDGVRWDLLQEGALSGGTNALDRMSDYYIGRAEQIQPVIQVAAGRAVDITFTHGAEIGDLHCHDEIKTLRDQSRRGVQ